MTNDDQQQQVDPELLGNLDALGRDISNIEALAAAALTDEPAVQAMTAELANVPTGLSYAELSASNRQRRETERWGEPNLAELLDAAALEQLDQWRAAQRLQWDRTDLVIVGVAGLMGALANLYDTQVDKTILKGLGQLKNTELLRRWEKDTERLPIDYTGPKFGGPSHRGLSPGHDLGRLFNAVNQIRTGAFSGTYWESGVKFTWSQTTSRSGAPFAQATEPHLALALLMKHFAADFVTPMSLPLPGWTLFRDMPDRDLRKFAQTAYAGSNTGDGLNLRSGVLTPGLGMVITEVVIRTQCHLSAYLGNGHPRLSTSALAKCTEMMLAAHAAAGAVSLSKTAVTALAGEAAVAVRHLNVPVLLRVGKLALQARSDAQSREAAGVPSWSELLANEAATWTLPDAIRIAETLDE